jgi:ELWxxDGT repeat protein
MILPFPTSLFGGEGPLQEVPEKISMQPARVRFAWSCAALALLVLLAALPAVAQTPSLVADLATGTSWSVSSPAATGLFAASGKLFFAAGSGEPAVADAAGKGFELLADLCPGDCGSGPQFLGTVGPSSASVVLFLAFPTGQSGASLLYRTDGTRAGTYSLGVPLTAPSFGLPSTQAFAGGAFFFRVCSSGVSPCELWRTDGSLAGTGRVKDLAPGSTDDPHIDSVTAVGGKIFLFVEINGQVELWKSDGTEAGTVRVQTFDSAYFPSVVAGGTSHLYFVNYATVGTNPVSQVELWTSDGTPSGTLPVTAFPGTAAINQQGLQVLGDRAYFVANDVLHGDEIWSNDGTPESTARRTDFGFYSPFSDDVFLPLELGDRLLFAASDGLHGTQLFTTTGTPESTAVLPVSAPISFDLPLTRVGGRAVFWASSNGNFNDFSSLELWSTDGTPAGTERLAAACTGGCTLGPLSSTDNGFFFFVADAQGGLSVWTTNGTPQGTRRFTDLLPHDPQQNLQYGVAEPVFVGGRLFFALAQDPNTAGLWTSDGQPGGTRPVPSLAAGAGSSPQELVPLGGTLFFNACDGTRWNLYQTTGTPASTVERASFAVDSFFGCQYGAPQNLTVAGSTLFFWQQAQISNGTQLWRTDASGATVSLGVDGLSAGDGFPPALTPFGAEVFFTAAGNNGPELWRSDGTPAGTRLATELAAIPAPSPFVYEPFPLGTAGGLLYVAATSGTGPELWASDGTAAGTRRILSGAGEIYAAPLVTRAGPWTYFFARDTAGAAGLYRTDGTAAGTSSVADLTGAFPDLPPSDPVAYQGNLYFFAATATGRGLFRSDGTAAGTLLVKEFQLELRPNIPDAVLPNFPTVFAGRLFFAADDGSHGRELWSSDGTAAGTLLVREVNPGPASAAVADLTVAGGRLYFSAADPVHGEELWQTDGTAAGTRLAADLAPESASSSPDPLAAVGDRLYFVADDGIAGRELWTLNTAAPAGCQAGDTRLCLSAGRFQVEAEWMDFEGHTGVGHAVSLTADTGYFWFFASTNVETVVKVLDGRGLNGAFWVFYGALSNVSYTLTVTDTATGLSRRYVNPPGVFASVGDTDGFGPLGAYDGKAARVSTAISAASATLATSAASALVSARTDARAATGTCTPGAQRLCLQGGRFAVTAAWTDFQGKTGTGTAVPLTPDTGYFWFFDPANVEVMTKVLDGTGLNGKYWFFYGALSDVSYTLTVTDTRTGAVKTYKNPSGQFGSLGDTGAF